MWHIHNVVNAVEITKKCAKDLFNAQEDASGEWYDVDDVTHNGKLYFNEDRFEDMDYVWKEEYTKVLLKHKVKGDICFGSLEGDNAGQFWGYRFDGKGGIKELVGTLSYKEKEAE